MSSWTCTKCTYVHSDAEAQFLCCAICSAERPKLHAVAPATEPAAASAAPRAPAAARPRAKPPAGAKPRVSLSLQRPGPATTRPAPPAPAPTPPVDEADAAPPPTTAKKKPLAPLFLPKKRPAAPAPARPPLKAPRTAAAWPIQAQRTVALRFSMARDGEGRVRASIERGGPQAPAAGRRRVFEAERTCKLALAHEGKATCDVKIHLTLDVTGDESAPWRDRRTYTGARAAGGLGLLQSHLQKCIRRGNVDLAVRSAHELAGITYAPALREGAFAAASVA